MTYIHGKHSFQLFAKDYDGEQSNFILFCDNEAFSCNWYGPDQEWSIWYAGEACEANVWCPVTENVQEIDIDGQFCGYIRRMINHINFDCLRGDSIAYYCESDPTKS